MKQDYNWPKAVASIVSNICAAVFMIAFIYFVASCVAGRPLV